MKERKTPNLVEQYDIFIALRRIFVPGKKNQPQEPLLRLVMTKVRYIGATLRIM